MGIILSLFSFYPSLPSKYPQVGLVLPQGQNCSRFEQTVRVEWSGKFEDEDSSLSCVLVYFVLYTKYHRLTQFWRPGSPKVWNPARAFLLLSHVAEGQAGRRYQSEEASPTQFLLGNPFCDCGIKLFPKGGTLKALSVTLGFCFCDSSCWPETGDPPASAFPGTSITSMQHHAWPPIHLSAPTVTAKLQECQRGLHTTVPGAELRSVCRRLA